MRATITTANVLAVLKNMAPDMVGHQDHLCQLDAAMGDGDQGITMAIGFQAIASAIEALNGQDIGAIVTKCGLAFNGAAASTIGALFATACMRAGREVKGKAEIGVADLANMVEAAFAGIQERGKAQVGDKTVLDALAPAEQGLRATIPLKSKVGRGAWIADRTMGHQDPGATSFCLMLKSAVEHLTSDPGK